MGRSPCCDKTKVKKGPWSNEEDALLINFVANYGNGGNWISLPKRAGLNRCGKSCRLRWLNYLRPDIKHGDFTEEEDYMIYKLHNIIGSRWSIIASKLSGRTDNDVKNYWNTKLKRKISSGKFNINNNNYDAGISSNINNTAYSTLYWPTLGNNENLIINSELNVSSKDHHHHHQFMQLEQQSGHNDNFNMDESEQKIREKCTSSSSSRSSSSSSSVDFNQSNGIDLIAVRGEEDEFWMDLLSDSFDDGVVVGSILDEKILEMASLLDDSFNC